MAVEFVHDRLDHRLLDMRGMWDVELFGVAFGFQADGVAWAEGGEADAASFADDIDFIDSMMRGEAPMARAVGA